MSTINRACYTPYIGIMMSIPSTSAVHFCCTFLPCFRQVFQHGKQRLMHFREISKLCRPVIHFGVNIDGIFTIPWRRGPLIPDSLQISWLPTTLCTGDETV